MSISIGNLKISRLSILLTSLLVILFSCILFLYFYGMGNHFKDVVLEFTPQENNFIETVKKQYNFYKVTKLGVIPKDKVTEHLASEYVKRATLRFYTTDKIIIKNDDSLYSIGKVIAKEFMGLPKSNLKALNIYFINTSIINYDSVKQYFYSTP